MWNKRKEEDFAPKPTPVPTPTVSPEATRRETPAPAAPAPAASTPRPVEQEGSRGGGAMVGKSVVLKGQIISREDLYIDGEVEGTVETAEHRLTVGPHGRVQAGIKAREIVVLGTVTGNVEATDKVEIRKEARLVGDLKTARIVIEDGAFFKGSIDIIRPGEAKKPGPTPVPSPMQSSPAPSPVTAGPAPAPAGVGASSMNNPPLAASAVEQPKR